MGSAGWSFVRLLRSNRGVSDRPTAETKEGGGDRGKDVDFASLRLQSVDLRNNEFWTEEEKKKKEGPWEADLSEILPGSWKLTVTKTLTRCLSKATSCILFALFHILSHSNHKRQRLFGI